MAGRRRRRRPGTQPPLLCGRADLRSRSVSGDSYIQVIMKDNPGMVIMDKLSTCAVQRRAVPALSCMIMSRDYMTCHNIPPEPPLRCQCRFREELANVTQTF